MTGGFIQTGQTTFGITHTVIQERTERGVYDVLPKRIKNVEGGISFAINDVPLSDDDKCKLCKWYLGARLLPSLLDGLYATVSPISIRRLNWAPSLSLTLNRADLKMLHLLKLTLADSITKEKNLRR